MRELASAHATPPGPILTTRTLRIPFFNPEHAAIAKRSLDVDREVNLGLVDRQTSLEGEVLVV